MASMSLLFAIAAPSRALGRDVEDTEFLPVRWRASQTAALVSFDVTASFTEHFRRRLAGGLTSRVVLEIVLEDRNRRPIALKRRECRLRLDIWDDRIYARIEDELSTRRLDFLLTDDALRACGVVRDLPIAETALLAPRGGYRVFVKVLLNPVSMDLLERTREFTWNPTGSPPGRGRAVIGAVAKLFRSDSETGDEMFLFRSESLERPRTRPE